jgi:hypothetical protein
MRNEGMHIFENGCKDLMLLPFKLKDFSLSNLQKDNPYIDSIRLYARFNYIKFSMLNKIYGFLFN